MEINDLLHAAVDSGASDILLVSGAPPVFRVAGRLEPAPLPALTPPDIEALCREVLSSDQWERLQRDKDVDFSVTVPGLGRFRFNVHWQKRSPAAAIRYLANSIPSLEELRLPSVVERLTHLTDGLVLVTGQTGSGKSTTLAAMIDLINRRDAKHIITLEDPIEYQHAHAKSLVEQREIGVDCPSFASGLRHVLRQDPDVILVGELRDLETIRTALQAAETGHLVLATLHSSSAAGAVDRIVEVFPAEEQTQIRTHLAECLRAVLTQRLFPSADGHGRVVAVEVLVATQAIRSAIREGQGHLIPGMISTGRKHGMQTMEQAVRELALNGLVSMEVLEEWSAERPAEVCV